MDTIDIMDKLLTTIEDHLEADLNIDKLAKEAMLSKFYFQRLFYKLVGVNVMQYVRLRRLARAADDLKEGDKVTDVAFRYGFNSHEVFTRAFKAVYDITPSAYSHAPIPLAHFYRPDLKLKYRMADFGVPIVASGIVLEMHLEQMAEPMHLAGVIKTCRMVPAGQDNPGMAWDAFHAKKETISGKSTPSVECGISMGGEEEGTFRYLAAAKVEAITEAHKGLDTFTIPAGDYVVCTFSAEDFFQMTNSALDAAIGYLMQTWLPNSDYTMNAQYMVERYDDRCIHDNPANNGGYEVVSDRAPEMDIMVKVTK